MSVQDAIEIDGDPTAVYRLYGADGTLLYIGVTRNIAIRFAHHEANKPWWPLVARKTMTWYGSRSDAEAAEDAAIDAERPLYNIKGAARETEPSARLGSWCDRSLTMKDAETFLAGSGKAAGSSPPVSRRPYGRKLAHGRKLLYKLVADEIAKWITEDAYPQGGRLPSEPELAAEFGASRESVRRAVEELRKRGLVETVKGKGSFVLPPEERPSQMALP
jgi:biotin operon repressor